MPKYFLRGLGLFLNQKASPKLIRFLTKEEQDDRPN